MAAPVRGERGGIFALCRLIEDHGEAIEYDLMTRTPVLRLRDVGTDSFPWRDLDIFVRNLPRDSALAYSFHGDKVLWGPKEHLLADLVDVARWMQWSKTKDASKTGAKPPAPIERPGRENPERKTRVGKPEPLENIVEWLGGDFKTMYGD